MFDRDFDDFANLLDGVISLNPNWKPVNPAGKALYFRAMAAYSLEQITSAMTAHIRDPKVGMFQPTPAHLIAKIEQQSDAADRPGADEAWAIALTSRDESDTVVWTTEMAEAFALCGPVLAMGDEVGARMAFKDAYTRLVNQAKAAGKPVTWNVSMGWDAGKREAALEKAKVAGLLSAPAARVLLPNHAPEAIAEPCPEGLKRVKEELAKLQAGWAERDARRAAEREAERKVEQEKKDRIAEQVQQYSKSAVAAGDRA
jgi:hypothetical protein